MELKNSKESYEALNSCVAAYYRAKNESCLTLGAPKIEISVFDNKEYQDTYVQKFFVKRKYFILICIPIDTRNFYAGIIQI